MKLLSRVFLKGIPLIFCALWVTNKTTYGIAPSCAYLVQASDDLQPLLHLVEKNPSGYGYFFRIQNEERSKSNKVDQYLGILRIDRSKISEAVSQFPKTSDAVIQADSIWSSYFSWIPSEGLHSWLAKRCVYASEKSLQRKLGNTRIGLSLVLIAEDQPGDTVDVLANRFASFNRSLAQMVTQEEVLTTLSPP